MSYTQMRKAQRRRVSRSKPAGSAPEWAARSQRQGLVGGAVWLQNSSQRRQAVLSLARVPSGTPRSVKAPIVAKMPASGPVSGSKSRGRSESAAGPRDRRRRADWEAEEPRGRERKRGVGGPFGGDEGVGRRSAGVGDEEPLVDRGVCAGGRLGGRCWGCWEGGWAWAGGGRGRGETASGGGFGESTGAGGGREGVEAVLVGARGGGARGLRGTGRGRCGGAGARGV